MASSGTDDLVFATPATTGDPPLLIDDDLPFDGYIQPPDVPPDPTGEDWRGPPGPPGPAGGAGPSTTLPLMDGTAAVGTDEVYSRGDHIHPSDINRYPANNPLGFVDSKGAAAAAPVQSVAGRVGTVTLTHSDITDWTTSLAPYAPIANPTFTGTVTLPGSPTTTLQAATKGYVDSKAGSAGIPDAPSDSVYYARRNAGWTNAATAAPVQSVATRTGTVVLTHSDITDWTSTLAPYALTSSVPVASTTLPLIEGTAAVGTGTTWARADHVHPASGGGAAVTVSDTPPASPTSGQQWWDSVGGQMYLWYVDPNSSQWVPASSQAAGIGDAPNDANTYGRHANGWTQAATPASVTAAVAPALNDVGRNRLHNGGFRINQRTYVSGTALAAAAYAHDRWKAGAGGCTYTFTQTYPSTTITITAGTLQQIVDLLDVEGGTYTLSWTGTAQGRVNAGSYAASPVTVTGLPAATTITVEFNTGTLSTVQLEPGSVATQFERQSAAMDYANCLRFFQTYDGVRCTGYAGAGSVNVYADFAIPRMRAVPAVVISNAAYSNGSAFTGVVYYVGHLVFQCLSTAAGSVVSNATIAASADL
jgi:hypothetical protein